MNDELADNLLNRVLDLAEGQLTEERTYVQAISSYKFDHYQQFAPGLKFVDSLCLWLKQFSQIPERLIAYKFVKNNLIYISQPEMHHLIKMAYQDVIKPFLINQVANSTELDFYQIKKIINHNLFHHLVSHSLFLALSDGAHIENFRRVSGLRHEQMYPTYLISEEKKLDFIEKLRKYLKLDENQHPKYELVFLIDDFSGSGYSFIHEEKDGSFDGKLIRFHKSISENLFDVKKLKICVFLYIATQRAKNEIETLGKNYFEKHSIEFTILVVHILNESIYVTSSTNTDLIPILKKYYNPEIETESYTKGDMSEPHMGFNGCALPLVLFHNCPNNSLPILWMDPDRYAPNRGLFPRLERFVKE